jgi:hypothetical protein
MYSATECLRDNTLKWCSEWTSASGSEPSLTLRSAEKAAINRAAAKFGPKYQPKITFTICGKRVSTPTSQAACSRTRSTT